MHRIDVATVSLTRGPQARDLAAIQVTGEIDIANAERLRAVIDEALTTGGDLLVDLSDCRFLDSSGVTEIVRAYRATTEAGRTLLVVSPPGTVPARVLALTLTGLQPIHPARDAALAALDALDAA
jgi:anti-sigma B factor antagonist